MKFELSLNELRSKIASAPLQAPSLTSHVPKATANVKADKLSSLHSSIHNESLYLKQTFKEHQTCWHTTWQQPARHPF